METEPLQGRDEDAVASANFSSMLSEEEKQELKAELVQVCLVILLLLYLYLDLELLFLWYKSHTTMGMFHSIKFNKSYVARWFISGGIFCNANCPLFVGYSTKMNGYAA